MSDEFKFRCEKCGKLFDPDPSLVTEAGIVSSEDYEKHYTEGQEWKGEAPVTEGAIMRNKRILALTVIVGCIYAICYCASFHEMRWYHVGTVISLAFLLVGSISYFIES